jgi:DNA-binding protein YbaB
MSVLEGKRKQIEKMIKELQKELTAIKKRVAQERFEQKGGKRI